MLRWMIFIAVTLAALVPVRADGPPGPSQQHRHRDGSEWISRGQKNAAGEWCCGEGDCALMSPGSVTMTAHGFAVHGVGTITEGVRLSLNFGHIGPLSGSTRWANRRHPEAVNTKGGSHSALMFAALMIGHHFSISALW